MTCKFRPTGRVELTLPLPAGAEVTMYVFEKSDAELGDLLAASVSSTDFWNNPEDGEDWSNA